MRLRFLYLILFLFSSIGALVVLAGGAVAGVATSDLIVRMTLAWFLSMFFLVLIFYICVKVFPSIEGLLFSKKDKYILEQKLFDHHLVRQKEQNSRPTIPIESEHTFDLDMIQSDIVHQDNFVNVTQMSNEADSPYQKKLKSRDGKELASLIRRSISEG